MPTSTRAANVGAIEERRADEITLLMPLEADAAPVDDQLGAHPDATLDPRLAACRHMIDRSDLAPLPCKGRGNGSVRSDPRVRLHDGWAVSASRPSAVEDVHQHRPAVDAG